MKKIILTLCVIFCTGILSAQVKVSILGDSYSTYEGWNPKGQAIWYDKNLRNDVDTVAQTWWYQLIEDNGLELELNNSYSGSTICNTGYNGADYTDRSFLTRSRLLGDNPDIIYVFGGTNDSWAGAPIGNADEKDMYKVKPATYAMFKNIKEAYPEALCVAIINSELSNEVVGSIVEACEKENIPYVKLVNIDKQNGHPSINGMKQISRQVWKATAPHLYKKLKSK
ncbi:MAG: hypothetical protein J1F38_01580 [Muribaculaceae bacterium]|nr:hypothetical protein [Muribaculaceae bacterium]